MATGSAEASREISVKTLTVEAIREKFENFEYDLDYTPFLIHMDLQGIYVNADAPYPDFLEEIDMMRETERFGINHCRLKEPILMPKLQATCGADWLCDVFKYPAEYFRSRETFDELVLEKELRSFGIECIPGDKISIREALKKMEVSISVNMEYYKQNKSELDEDYGDVISHNIDTNNEHELKRIEQVLFYKLMCNIIGKENDDDCVNIDGVEVLHDKSFMIRDFNILSNDCNQVFASATRDNFYLYLYSEFT